MIESGTFMATDTLTKAVQTKTATTPPTKEPPAKQVPQNQKDSQTTVPPPAQSTSDKTPAEPAVDKRDSSVQLTGQLSDKSSKPVISAEQRRKVVQRISAKSLAAASFGGSGPEPTSRACVILW